jgi:hypothetical protein
MLMGCGFLVLGVVLTLLTSALFAGKGAILFWGAVLVGSIQLLIGIGQRIRYRALSPERKKQEHSQAAVTTLVRCMAMVANADGMADDGEIATITRICQDLAGQPIPLATVRELVAKIGTGGSEPWEFVSSKAMQASLEWRIVIAKACRLLLLQKSDVSKQELRVYKQVLSGLTLPPDPFLKDLKMRQE